MNVQIRSKDVKIGDKTKAHIEAAIATFGKYTLDITTVNVNVKKEKKSMIIEFDIHVAHAEPIIISQVDDSLDAAIDLAIDRATKALRRLHDRLISHKADSIKNLETTD